MVAFAADIVMADNLQGTVEKRVKKTEFARPSRAAKAAQVSVDAGVFSVPFVLTPTADDFDKFEKLDANEDGITLQLSGTAPDTYLSYSCSETNPADDWVFIPVNITDLDMVYKISVDVRVRMSSYPENFEVGVGASATPSAMTILMDKDYVNNEEYQTYSCFFTADNTGVQYIDVHINSVANQYKFISGIYL